MKLKVILHYFLWLLSFMLLTSCGRHYIKQQAYPLNYTEKGTASWYGKKFHGRKTANGEIYNMYDYTAAHKYLPLGSQVRVKNLKNHKSVIVKINDRGPFIRGRILDLSYQAALCLDMVENGLAPIQLEIIKLPEENSKNHFIQIGSFSDYKNARKVYQELSPTYQIRMATLQKEKTKTFYRIWIGPYNRSAEVKRKLWELKDAGFPDSFIITR